MSDECVVGITVDCDLNPSGSMFRRLGGFPHWVEGSGNEESKRGSSVYGWRATVQCGKAGIDTDGGITSTQRDDNSGMQAGLVADTKKQRGTEE